MKDFFTPRVRTKDDIEYTLGGIALVGTWLFALGLGPFWLKAIAVQWIVSGVVAETFLFGYFDRRNQIRRDFLDIFAFIGWGWLAVLAVVLGLLRLLRRS